MNKLHNLFFNQIMFFSNIFLSFYYQRSIQKRCTAGEYFVHLCTVHILDDGKREKGYQYHVTMGLAELIVFFCPIMAIDLPA